MRLILTISAFINISGLVSLFGTAYNLRDLWPFCWFGAAWSKLSSTETIPNISIYSNIAWDMFIFLYLCLHADTTVPLFVLLALMKMTGSSMVTKFPLRNKNNFPGQVIPPTFNTLIKWWLKQGGKGGLGFRKTAFSAAWFSLKGPFTEFT